MDIFHYFMTLYRTNHYSNKVQVPQKHSTWINSVLSFYNRMRISTDLFLQPSFLNAMHTASHHYIDCCIASGTKRYHKTAYIFRHAKHFQHENYTNICYLIIILITYSVIDAQKTPANIHLKSLFIKAFMLFP